MLAHKSDQNYHVLLPLTGLLRCMSPLRKRKHGFDYKCAKDGHENECEVIVCPMCSL